MRKTKEAAQSPSRDAFPHKLGSFRNNAAFLSCAIEKLEDGYMLEGLEELAELRQRILHTSDPKVTSWQRPELDIFLALSTTHAA